MTRGAALALVLAGLLAASGRGARAADDPAARVRDAARRYEAHLLAERPDLASACGFERADERLEPVTEATLEHDARFLAALVAELDSLPAGGLAPRARTTLDTLRARVAREAAPLAADAWRHDPALYRTLVHGSVLAAVQRPHVSPCERTRRAIRRLRAVPEVLRAAQVNLHALGAFDRERETSAWTAAMLDLRTLLPATAEGCHDAERYADLVEADSLALTAARRFVAFLHDDGTR